MINVRKAGIVIKPHAPSVEGILKIVVEYFEGRGVACVLEDAAARKLGPSRRAGPGRRSPRPPTSSSSSAATGRSSVSPTTRPGPASRSWASTWAGWAS